MLPPAVNEPPACVYLSGAAVTGRRCIATDYTLTVKSSHCVAWRAAS